MKKLLIAIGLLTILFEGKIQAQFSICVNTGLSGLQYKSQYGKSKILPSLGAEIGYTKVFSNHWALLTGIGVTRYATDATVTNGSTLIQNQVDDVGAAFEYRDKPTEYMETQRLYGVNIPLMMQYRTGNEKKVQWYFNAGARFIAPLDLSVKATAQQIDLSGYYPDVNLTINELQQHGFGTVYNWSKETKYVLKPTVAATAGTGVSFTLGNGDKFYVGVYGTYGLTDMKKVTDMPLVSYNAPISSGVLANSVLSTNGVNKVRIFDVGIQLKMELGRKKIVLIIKPEPPDGDHDGVPDSLDLCPCKAGCTAFRGCPDTDGDGIPDNLDKCPDVKGLEKYQGCPIPDRDKDGINDEEDKCPDVPGVARYQGCPIPDTDGDGVNDEEDKCPKIKGTKENNGCPEIKKEVLARAKYAADNILFSTGTATLVSSSYKGLNEIVKILEDAPGIKLFIDGHTDFVGSDSSNVVLSQKRAKAVMDYLISKGVSASILTATGFGKSKPIADNQTPEGRLLNRRVELRLTYDN